MTSEAAPRATGERTATPVGARSRPQCKVPQVTMRSTPNVPKSASYLSAVIVLRASAEPMEKSCEAHGAAR